MKNSKKVKLNKRMAKWYLDNLEVFWSPGKGDFDGSYDACMQMCIDCLLDGDVIGTVGRPGAVDNTYFVKFKTPYGVEESVYELGKHVTLV